MGAAVYIVLEKALPGLQPAVMVDGKSIAQNWDDLNGLGRAKGARPLEEFLSTSRDELACLIGEDAVQESDIELPSEEWFLCAEGLATVQALVDLVRASPAFVADQERVLKDLQSYQEVLKAGAAAAARFHLAFDF
jgi:hypothetical protein